MADAIKSSVKRVRSDRCAWREDSAKGFLVEKIKSGDISGYITLATIDHIHLPWTWGHEKEKFCIADLGYGWFSYFPEGKRYVVHAIFDSHACLVLWYIDICSRHCLSEDGVPYFDDLFLDIVVLPSRKYFLKDEEELWQALTSKVITKGEYDQAGSDGSTIIENIKNDEFPFFEYSQSNYKLFHARLP